MKQVCVSELRSHLSEHLRRAEAGEVVEVLHRARPIAKVVPVEAEGTALEVIAAERPFASVRSVRLPPLELPMSSLEALRQDRGAR
jgi:prevent-host-death family protein